MHKKIFFGLLILYIVLPLQAQYVVKGKIVDSVVGYGFCFGKGMHF